MKREDLIILADQVNKQDYYDNIHRIEQEREAEKQKRIEEIARLKAEIDYTFWLYQTYEAAAREQEDENERSFMYMKSEEQERIYTALVELHETLYRDNQ